MKNLKLIVLLLVIGISSCKKDDSKNDAPKPEVKASIVGKWKLTGNKEISYKNGVKQEEYTTFQEGSIEFMNDGKAVFEESDYTYKIEGENRLLLTYKGDTEPYVNVEITKLTASELVLSKEESHTAKNGDVFKTVTQLSFSR
jgi:hypothetical protein